MRAASPLYKSVYIRADLCSDGVYNLFRRGFEFQRRRRRRRRPSAAPNTIFITRGVVICVQLLVVGYDGGAWAYIITRNLEHKYIEWKRAHAYIEKEFIRIFETKYLELHTRWSYLE